MSPRTELSPLISSALRTMTSVPALAVVKAWLKSARWVSPMMSVAARNATPRTTAVTVPNRRRLRDQRPVRMVVNISVSELLEPIEDPIGRWV